MGTFFIIHYLRLEWQPVDGGESGGRLRDGVRRLEPDDERVVSVRSDAGVRLRRRGQPRLGDGQQGRHDDDRVRLPKSADESHADGDEHHADPGDLELRCGRGHNLVNAAI